MPAGPDPATLRAYEKASDLYARGRHDEARTRAISLLERDPGYGPALHLVAVIAFLQYDRPVALEYAQRATEADPGSVRYRKTLVQVLYRSARFDEAVAVASEGLATSPESIDLLDVQAEALLAAGRPRDAVRPLQAALKLEPNNFRALLRIGGAFGALGLREPALSAYRNAATAEPDDARPHFGAGIVLRNEGDYAQAKASFLRAHELDSNFVDPLVQLARVEKASAGDVLFDRLEKQLSRTDLRARGRAMIGFALGKMYEDVGDYDRAFDHFAAANRQRARDDDQPSAADHLAAVGETLERCCDERFFAERRDQGAATELPVFIVGMPRSGTTLIETILACHPAVYGAGELVHVPDIRRGLVRETPPSDWDPLLLGLPAAAVERAAQAYAAHLQSLAPGAARVIDKMPGNFEHLWLIALLFPRARVIHARRDAADTCLSCFVTNFEYAHNYRNDLATLGRYYRSYRRLMKHWRRVCPLPLLEIDYEELVADQEKISRRMVDFLGLDWHPDCLEFHKSSRSVQTASNVQVGRKMYQSSVQRWRRYERHLGPLLEELARDD